jgi:superfamily II DNA helicase RecQ
MSRKERVHYQLSDLREQEAPSEQEIRVILRAADDITSMAGRTMLAKILKGSKDKKLLEKELNLCPSYGYYNHLTIEAITKIIDWMIVKDYLDIDYNGLLPVIVFSDKGWELYKPIYVEELCQLILSVNEATSNTFVEKLMKTNREVITILLLKIGESKNIGFIRFLRKWERVEVKKVRIIINAAIVKLKSI